jgi:hypothetical protein
MLLKILCPGSGPNNLVQHDQGCLGHDHDQRLRVAGAESSVTNVIYPSLSRSKDAPNLEGDFYANLESAMQPSPRGEKSHSSSGYLTVPVAYLEPLTK